MAAHGFFGEFGEELALIEEKPWARRKEFLALNPAGSLPVLLAEARGYRTAVTHIPGVRR